MTPQNEAASARSELTSGFGRHKLTGPKKENALISFAPGNLGHQRESEGGPAGGGGRGTDDDCTLGCGGLYCGMEAACWDGDGGGDDTFCLVLLDGLQCRKVLGHLFLLGSERAGLCLESPMMAGMAITAADPSGLWGLLKESFAGAARWRKRWPIPAPIPW